MVAPNSTPSNILIPDPSTATTQQINRAKDEFKAEVSAALKAMTSIFDAKLASLDIRLDSMDKAATVLSENVNRVPTLLDREIARVLDLLKRGEELTNEKFASVSQQFKERDVRSDQDKFANSTAINAALSALKEMIGLQNNANSAAIAKSEASTTKELESLNRIISSSKEALTSDIRNIASRLDRGEAADTGLRMAKSDDHATLGSTMAVVVGVIGGLALLVSIVVAGFTISRGAQQTPTVVSPAVVPLK